MATTPILPLAWEPPYAVGMALEKKKKKKKKAQITVVLTVFQWLFGSFKAKVLWETYTSLNNPVPPTLPDLMV